MGTKSSPAKFDCYENALPDEPMFILLARDPIAPELVDQWATERHDAIERGDRPASDMAMVTEAYSCARSMYEWRRDNGGKWRAPPVAEAKKQESGK
jgi:hypothetical protein